MLLLSEGSIYELLAPGAATTAVIVVVIVFLRHLRETKNGPGKETVDVVHKRIGKYADKVQDNSHRITTLEADTVHIKNTMEKMDTRLEATGGKVDRGLGKLDEVLRRLPEQG